MYLENLIKQLSDLLGLGQIPLTSFLIYSALFFFCLTLYLFVGGSKRFVHQQVAHIDSEGSPNRLLERIVLGVIFAITVIALYDILRLYNQFSYPLSLIFSLYALLILFTLIPFFAPRFAKKRYRWALVGSVTIIVALSTGMVINGIEAQETTADTINIFFNNGFSSSIHNPAYDMAPVDSLIKVAVLRILGIQDPFNPFISMLIYSLAGIAVLLFLWWLVKTVKHEELVWVLPAILVLAPYTLGAPLSVPPGNLANAFVIIAAVSILIPVVSKTQRTRAVFVIYILTSTVAIFTHPLAIGLLPFTLIIFASSKLSVNSALRHVDKRLILFYTSVVIVTGLVWSSKAIVFSTAYGELHLIERILNPSFSSALSSGASSYAFGNAPNLSLITYTSLIGVCGGIALIELFRFIINKTHKPSPFFLANCIVYLVLASVTVFTLQNGSSQSRYLLSPYTSLIAIVILLYIIERIDKLSISRRKLLGLMISLMAIGTMISPITFPDQYSFQQANKFSTSNDYAIMSYVIAYMPSSYFVDSLSSSSKDFVLYQIGQSSKMNTPMTAVPVWSNLIAEHYVVNNTIPQQTMAGLVNNGPIRFTREDTVANMTSNNVVFSGWVYVLIKTSD